MRDLHSWQRRSGASTVRRQLGLFCLLALLLIAPVFGTTYYVDGACTNNGNGRAIDCASGSGGTGAWNCITCASGLSAGDTVNIRGIHTSHGSNHAAGTFDGRYGKDWNQVTINGAAGNNVVIQAYGWTTTGAGTQETVYIEGTAAPGSGTNLGWTQCADCSAGSAVVACRNVPSTCGDVWWTVKTATDNPGNQILMLWAQRPDGSMTFREDKNTCSGASLDNQYDSCSAEVDGATLAVRWGASTPNSTNKPYVVFDNNGYGFFLQNSTYVTIRGFNFRGFRSVAIVLVGTTNNITIVDNKFSYISHTNGFDHAVSTGGGDQTNITVTDNEMFYIGSEAIHTQAMASGATVWTIARNYIHDLGDLTVMGPGAGLANTPTCMILGDSGGGSGNGNYTGSVVENNLCINTALGSSPGAGISFENVSTNWIMRNNILKNIAGECIRLEGSGGSGVADNEIYNNVLQTCGQNKGAGTGAGIYFNRQGSGPVSGNKFYNNTVVNGAEIGIDSSNPNVPSGNFIRNNIIVSSVNKQCVEWATADSTNKLENNLCLTGAGTAVKWLGASFSSANFASGCSGTCPNSKIGDPLFTNTSNNDFHIQSASPAKDAGTSTGMPSGRTADINNTIADDHGLPNYGDGQTLAGNAWDMGVDEVSTGGTVTLTISKTDSPDPVVPGNQITYTLAYQNTGSASATGVTIADNIPTNTTFVSATGGGTSNGTTVTWNIGAVAAGASGSVQMVVGVTSPLADGTIISNSAYSIISNESSSVSGVADTTTVTSLPVIQLSMSDAPDPVLAGSNITYTIFYSNTGTAGATNVVITDAVPVNTTFVSATNSGSESGGTVTWSIGAVNAGTFGSVQMVVTASASLANGAQITNSTYTLASTELSTINGTPISTGVIAAVTTIPQPKFPITSRQNGWVQTQTLLFDGAADLVQTPNGGQWIRGQASENLTLSTSGATTDTTSNLLPANAIIEAVTARVTTTITTAANWKLGDAAQPARFTAAQTGLTAGTTVVGLNQADPTVASADLGPVQSSAAKVRVTCNTTPGAGAIRITVFYRQFVPPTN